MTFAFLKENFLFRASSWFLIKLGMKGVRDVYITGKGGWDEDRSSPARQEDAFLKGKDLIKR